MAGAGAHSLVRLPSLALRIPEPSNLPRTIRLYLRSRRKMGVIALVVVVDRPGVLHRITEVIYRRGINIKHIVMTFEHTERKVVGYMVLEVEEGSVESALREVAKELQSMPEIERAEVMLCATPHVCVVSHLFPMVLGGFESAERVVLLHVAALREMLAALSRYVAGLAPVLMYDQGERYGEIAADSVIRALPGLAVEELLKVLAEGYRGAGFGYIVEISSIEASGVVTGYRVVIKDNWEAEGTEGCHMTRGILGGIFKRVFGVKFAVVEERHNDRGLCVFRLTPLT